MPYDKDDLYGKAKKAIVDNNLFFVEDIVAFMPCVKSTFYEYFPAGSDEMNEFKELLEVNKVKTKSSIRAKLWKSNKAAELLALYRLIATPDEHRLLNQSYIDHTSKNKRITSNEIDPTKLSTSALKEIKKQLQEREENENPD